MATTETIVMGDGGNTYSFSFPYLKKEDVKVELQEYDSTQTGGLEIVSRQNITAFTIPANQPTQVVFDAIGADTTYQTAPDGDVKVTSTNGYPVRVRIYRFTDAAATPATFSSGSAIRAKDLNDNFEQTLFIMQERQNTLNTIATGGIGENTINTNALQDNSVTDAKLRSSSNDDSLRSVTNDHIRDGAVTTEKISGNIKIGTPGTPAQNLHIASTQPTIRLQDTDGTGQIADIYQAGSGLYIENRNNTLNGQIIFRGRGGGAFNEYARFNTNGYLGIGTDTPTEEIHIARSAPTIRLQDTDGTNQYTNIYQIRGGVYLDARNGTAKGYTIFRGFDGTNPSVEYARFTPNGYLGIGTFVSLGIDPVVPLHIAADDPMNARIRIQDGDGTNQYSDFLQSVGALYIDSRNNTNNGPIIFRGVNSSTVDEYGRFTSNGYLGIGTQKYLGINPAVPLHIATDGPNFARIRLQQDNSAGGGPVNQYADIFEHQGNLYLDSRNNTFNGPIIFRGNGASSEYGRFTSVGNLGVGISAATEKLHVGGNILATGSVTADSLSVTNQISGAQVQPEFTANNTATFGTPTGNVHLEVGGGATANRYASVDLVGDTTNTDYGTRFYREASGVNAASGIAHKGTGNFNIICENNGQITFNSNGSLRGYFRVNDGRFILDTTGSRGASGAVLTTSNDSVANAIRVVDPQGTNYIELTTDIGAVGVNVFLSDINLKTNIIDSTASASDIIGNISFKEFDWKPESGQEGHVDIGVVAQQVAEVEPRLTRSLSDGKMSINESTFMTYTAKALQEALGRIEQLEAQVAALQS